MRPERKSQTILKERFWSFSQKKCEPAVNLMISKAKTRPSSTTEQKAKTRSNSTTPITSKKHAFFVDINIIYHRLYYSFYTQCLAFYSKSYAIHSTRRRNVSLSKERKQSIVLVPKVVQILELSNIDFKITQINTLKNTL